jgi:hypothetical protein
LLLQLPFGQPLPCGADVEFISLKAVVVPIVLFGVILAICLVRKVRAIRASIPVNLFNLVALYIFPKVVILGNSVKAAIINVETLVTQKVVHNLQGIIPKDFIGPHRRPYP